MIGIMGAMPEEIQTLTESLEQRQRFTLGSRTFEKGTLWGHPVVIAFSRWGKVASSATATQMISEFGVKDMIFTGVAGAIHDDLNVGDIVIGTHVYQHDMDASPLFEKFEIPLIHKKSFSLNHSQSFYESSNAFLETLSKSISSENRKEFQIHSPKVLLGEIASGDQFISTEEKRASLKENLPSVLCVEMEGGAVAQVCYEYEVSFSLIRTISDSANEKASVDFPKFIKEVASQYSFGILKHYLKK